MKLRNKKTWEIIELFNNTDGVLPSSLSELCEEWTDYEEPEGYWYIDDLGRVQFSCFSLDEADGKPNNGLIRKCYGNYFSSKKEAKLAVRKLQAWKRLKDKGFEFKGWSLPKDGEARIIIEATVGIDIAADLDLLFRGGEE